MRYADKYWVRRYAYGWLATRWHCSTSDPCSLGGPCPAAGFTVHLGKYVQVRKSSSRGSCRALRISGMHVRPPRERGALCPALLGR
jgi:hypothetical protein